METKFFINEKRVDEKQAAAHWFDSATYASATKKTRDSIWRVALRGDSSGNHNPDGEITHLNEAGITLGVYACWILCCSSTNAG